MGPGRRMMLAVLAAAACATVIVWAIVLSQPDVASDDDGRLPAPAVLQQLFADHQQGSAGRAVKAGVPAAPAAGDPDEQHTHAAVRFVAAGAVYQPPLGLGVTDRGQQLQLHTHDRTGVVHMHQPAGQPPLTFKQLMAVWGVTFTDGQVDGMPARAWRNGQPAALTGDLRLEDRDDLIIELAGDPNRRKAPLPAFDWTAIPLAD